MIKYQTKKECELYKTEKISVELSNYELKVLINQLKLKEKLVGFKENGRDFKLMEKLVDSRKKLVEEIEEKTWLYHTRGD